MIHTMTEGCACRPTAVPVSRPDGSIGWVHAHHEPDTDPADQAERVAAICAAMSEVSAQ